MKINWRDFNIGMVVDSSMGKGSILKVDKTKNAIDIRLSTGKIQTFKINELKLGFGQLPLSLTLQIGQFILLYQRIENRLRDFMNNSLDLNKVQKKELTTFFTAGKLIDKVGSIIKNHSDNESIKKWEVLSSELAELNKIRNTIVHGYTFHFNSNFELDFESLYIENANGNKEILDLSKSDELNSRVVQAYYDFSELFIKIVENVKTNIKNSR